MRVWVGPVSKRLGGVDRYVHSLVTNSSSEFRVVREFRELLWGIRWAGRRIPLVRPLYGEYQRFLRGVDVAHVHRSPLYAEAFSESQQVLPWMFTLHGIGFEQYWRHRPDVVRWMKQANESALATVKRAPLATVVARWLKDFVEERTSASVEVTPPGVDFREFGETDASEFVRWSGLSPGFALWVGRFAHEKRLDWFVQLAGRFPDREFVAFADADESQVRAAFGGRWPRNLRYFGGAVRGHVVSAYHACSVYVSTSLYDAAPTTMVEAMACGKPVVAPDNLGAREIHEDSGACFLFRPDSFADLDEQFQRAVDHPEVGHRGLAFAREKRDWRRLAADFDRRYAGLAHRA